MNFVGLIIIVTQITLIIALDCNNIVNNEDAVMRYVKGRRFDKAMEKLKDLNNEDLKYALNYVIHDVYNNNERNLDLVINFADHCNDNPHIKISIYRALKNEIDANDLLKKLKIIRSINDIPDTYKFEKPEIEFRNTVRNLVKEELNVALKTENCAALSKLSENIEEYYNELFAELFKEVLREVYDKVNKGDLLKCLMSLKYKSQSIYGYLAMFNELKKESNGLNQELFVNLVFGMKEAVDSPNVREVARMEAWSLNEQLPKSVRALVNSRSVCIKNLHYPNEYLYAAIDTYKDYDDRRAVFTYTPGGKVTQGTWIIERNTNVGDVYHITNEDHKEYLYATNYARTFPVAPLSRFVFTWMRKGSPKESAQARWVFEPSGDNMYIKSALNNEYLYATEETKFESRRYVKTWLDGSKHEGSLWAIEDCSNYYY